MTLLTRLCPAQLPYLHFVNMISRQYPQHPLILLEASHVALRFGAEAATGAAEPHDQEVRIWDGRVMAHGGPECRLRCFHFKRSSPVALHNLQIFLFIALKCCSDLPCGGDDPQLMTWHTPRRGC